MTRDAETVVGPMCMDVLLKGHPLVLLRGFGSSIHALVLTADSPSLLAQRLHMEFSLPLMRHIEVILRQIGSKKRIEYLSLVTGESQPASQSPGVVLKSLLCSSAGRPRDSDSSAEVTFDKSFSTTASHVC